MKDIEKLLSELLESWHDFKCENDRIKVQLANAIKCLIRDDVFVSMEGLLTGLGMTEKEYNEIMN